jgi:ubiquitin carboxyl-terminal hydrolase 7
LPIKDPILTARDYYDHLLNRFKLKFLPKPGSPEEDGEFEIELNKKMVYDQLAVKVGEHLGVESTHLRFWYLNSNTGRPKGPMRRSPTSSLASLLGLNGPQYVNGGAIHNQRTDYLYYEKLEYSLTEMETRKNIKVNWVYDGIQKEVRIRA